MTCTRPRAESQKSLDPWVPSTHDPKQTSRFGPLPLSRFEPLRCLPFWEQRAWPKIELKGVWLQSWRQMSQGIVGLWVPTRKGPTRYQAPLCRRIRHCGCRELPEQLERRILINHQVRQSQALATEMAGAFFCSWSFGQLATSPESPLVSTGADRAVCQYIRLMLRASGSFCEYGGIGKLLVKFATRCSRFALSRFTPVLASRAWSACLV